MLTQNEPKPREVPNPSSNSAAPPVSQTDVSVEFTPIGELLQQPKDKPPQSAEQYFKPAPISQSSASAPTDGKPPVAKNPAKPGAPKPPMAPATGEPNQPPPANKSLKEPLGSQQTSSPPSASNAPLPPTPTNTLQQARDFIRSHPLFCAVVILPTLFATIYYGIFASDIYTSESKFVVRSPKQQQSSSSLGAMLAGATGGGVSMALGEVATVGEYISSRDALEKLQNVLNVAGTWGSSKVDLLNRFDPWGWNDSSEALFEYYPRRVTVSSNPLAGITLLSASSFDPENALKINMFLLKEAERLINDLNDRAREDLIKFASNEVKAAEDKAKAAATALSDFRHKEAVVDPEAQTQMHFDRIARLQEELGNIRSQLVQLRTFAPQSPHPASLEVRAKSLEREISEEMEKISGGEHSLARKAAEYQRLQLDREFADQQLAATLTSLETARNEAQRQQLYLETISKPSVPDHATRPLRVRGIFTTLALSLIAWGIIAMLVAGVREHQT